MLAEREDVRRALDPDLSGDVGTRILKEDPVCYPNQNRPNDPNARTLAFKRHDLNEPVDPDLSTEHPFYTCPCFGRTVVYGKCVPNREGDWGSATIRAGSRVLRAARPMSGSDLPVNRFVLYLADPGESESEK